MLSLKTLLLTEKKIWILTKMAFPHVNKYIYKKSMSYSIITIFYSYRNKIHKYLNAVLGFTKITLVLKQMSKC